MQYPRAEKISFVLFMLLVLAIKLLCDVCWRMDKDLQVAMLDFQQQQALQDSLQQEEKRRKKERAYHRYEQYRKESQQANSRVEDVRREKSPYPSKKFTEQKLCCADSVSPGRYSKIPDEIDINKVDSVGLVALPGIGAYTAKKILDYRQALGGYVSVNQLLEIEGLRAENLRSLQDVACVRLDSCGNAARQMNINKLSIKAMLRHPYLSYEQVIAIDDRRREFGSIDSLPCLLFLDEFSPDDLARLQPYLSFEK